MENKTLNKLLKQLPKKYHDRVVNFEQDNDLIDNCKYILTYSNNYCDGECVGGCIPFYSIKEAIAFIKFSLYDVSEEKKALKTLADEIYDTNINPIKRDTLIETFIHYNIDNSMDYIRNDYNILVNKDYNEESYLFLNYNDLYLDSSCRKIIIKLRG